MSQTINDAINSNSPQASAMPSQATGAMTEEKIKDILGKSPQSELKKNIIWTIALWAAGGLMWLWAHQSFFGAIFAVLLMLFGLVALVATFVQFVVVLKGAKKFNAFHDQLKRGDLRPDFYIPHGKSVDSLVIDRAASRVLISYEEFPLSALYKTGSGWTEQRSKGSSTYWYYMELYFKDLDEPRQRVKFGAGTKANDNLHQQMERLHQFLGWTK